MIDYVGVCPLDWQQLIEQLETQKPYVGPKHKAGDNIPGLDEVTDLWNKAGYGPTVSWDMFYPGDHFDINIVKQFAEWVNIPSYTNAWVSRVHPGYFAPQHWDVQDDEPLPDTVRYHVHMSRPQFGHIFIAEDKCLYNQEQGATYKWSSRKAWHAGTNCGLVPKYIFNIW
jgi:hypothetical protein